MCVLVPTEARKTASTPVELQMQEVMGHLELRWVPEPNSAQAEEQEVLGFCFFGLMSFFLYIFFSREGFSE